ncbi:hypothetical protein X551_02201 [Methylibium sp. T29]|nr:hypothetical protein X551_02201 [Methylibium sp. T29]
MCADVAHQRRRIHRARHDGAGHPAPAAADQRPAAIVEGREAPGRVVDPGPAPGPHVGPVPVAVGGPAVGQAARVPDGAVVRRGGPVAVLVERLDAGGLGRDIARGGQAVLVAVACLGPRIEVVALAHRAQLQLAAAVLDQAFLARFQVEGVVRRHHAQPSGQRAHGVGAAVGVVADAVIARALSLGAHAVGREAEAVAGGQAAHPGPHGALGHVDRDAVVVELREHGLRVAVQAHRTAADAHLGLAAGRHPQRGLAGDGLVELGRIPGRARLGRAVDRPAQRADAAHARGGIGRIGLGQRGPGQQQARAQACHQAAAEGDQGRVHAHHVVTSGRGAASAV